LPINITKSNRPTLSSSSEIILMVANILCTPEVEVVEVVIEVVIEKSREN
jgi:hypothetical protein